MATWPVRNPSAWERRSPVSSTIVEASPEAASQTFLRGALIVRNSAGFVAEATSALNPGTNNVLGVAERAGQNASSAGDVKSEFVPITEDLVVFMNFLGTSGGDNTIAITDVDVAYDVKKNTVSSVATWHLSDTTDTASARMVGLYGDEAVDGVSRDVLAADVNARVACQFLATVIQSIAG